MERSVPKSKLISGLVSWFGPNTAPADSHIVSDGFAVIWPPVGVSPEPSTAWLASWPLSSEDAVAVTPEIGSNCASASRAVPA